MAVTFRNDGTEALTRIVWHVRIASGWVSFKGDGEFDPGEVHTENLSWPGSYFEGYYSNAVQNCSVASYTTKSGSQWAAPDASSGFDFVDGANVAPGAISETDGIRYMLGQRVAGRLLHSVPAQIPVSTLNYDADPRNCDTVSVHFTDGTTWQNPDVGPAEPPIPTAPPTLPPN